MVRKNYPLTPDEITFGSNKKVWWIGSCGLEWQTNVKARSNGEKCPVCAGIRVVEGINDLVTLKPEIAQEWAEKNIVKPTTVSLGSKKATIGEKDSVLPNIQKIYTLCMDCRVCRFFNAHDKAD